MKAICSVNIDWWSACQMCGDDLDWRRRMLRATSHTWETVSAMAVPNLRFDLRPFPHGVLDK